MEDEIVEFSVDSSEETVSEPVKYTQYLSPLESYKKHSGSLRHTKSTQVQSNKSTSDKPKAKLKYQRRLIATSLIMIIGIIFILIGNSEYFNEYNRPENRASRQRFTQEYREDALRELRHSKVPRSQPIGRSATPPSTTQEKDAVYLAFFGIIICVITFLPLLFFINAFFSHRSKQRIEAIKDRQSEVQYYA